MFRRKRFPNSARMASCLLGLSVFVCSCAADLTVRNVHKEQFTGPLLVMKGTVKNQGLKEAGPSTTRLERTYNWNDPFVEMSRIATPALGKGESLELPLWTFPPTDWPEPGRCMHVRVCADVDDVVDESVEGNNCRTTSFMNQRYCRECDLCCSQTLPLVFDWRNHNGTNWVTPVRDQANCGSCWAFSAMAAVEAKNNVEKEATQQSPVDLSEQQFLSCPGGGGSCLGGWPHGAMHYMKNHEVVGEATLQYTSTNCLTGTAPNYSCRAQCTSAIISGCSNPLMTAAQCASLPNPSAPGGTNPPNWRIASYHKVQGSAVDDIKRALLCHGPLSVTSNAWGHAILLVGWTPGSWIIKNSWGTGYGVNGFGFIPFSGHAYSDIIQNAYYAQNVTRRP